MADISDRPRKGNKYIVTREFPTLINILHHGTEIDLENTEKSLPAGFRFIVDYDTPAAAIAVCATADPYDQWEPILVDAKNLAAEQYDGYYLSISFEDVENNCVRLS